jgi:hypothetical protein
MSSAFIEGRQGVDGESSALPSDEEESDDGENIDRREKLEDKYAEVDDRVTNQELKDRKGWEESI